MASTKLVICINLVLLCCIPFGDAWLWGHRHRRRISSFSWPPTIIVGPATIAPDIHGIPWVTHDWSIGVKVTIPFAKGDQCDVVEQARIKRADWGAIPPHHVEPMIGVAKRVFVWHTGSNTCDLVGYSGYRCQHCLQDKTCVKHIAQALQDDDLLKSLNDIKYNFLIGQDGAVYEGRGWGVVGENTVGKNAQSIGVGFIGDFTDKEPNQVSLDALSDLLVCGKMSSKLSSDAKMTSCPEMAGKAFHDMLKRCGGLC